MLGVHQRLFYFGQIIFLNIKYYENNITKKKCILVFDKASIYVNEEIIKYLIDNKKFYVIIPAGFTRFLQPLVISINKPFKLA